jgi:hypothetical protein
VLQLLSQSAGASFNDFSNVVGSSVAQIFGFSFGNILAFNADSPSFMFSSQTEPTCIYARDSLALNALSSGRISVVVDPTKEPSYNPAVDGPTGERIAFSVYVPVPDDHDPKMFIAVLVLARLLPASLEFAADTGQKQVSNEALELLKLVSIMLSAPLSRSVKLHATEKRLAE